MISSAQLPLVSIGMPVYNGTDALRRALDSILAQDYPDFELIISDNGSTDATPEICREYVGKDSRVKYYRSEENRGSIWNFNRVFELSSGKYFMWAAHDDWHEPSFVSACVEKMEKCPEAVLCQTHTAMFIGGRADVLCIASLNSFKGVKGLVERYRETLERFPATALYGLYRASAMRKTQMFQKSIATDLAFAQELSMHGEFVQVPKTFFHYVGRKEWSTVQQDYSFFLGNGEKPWWYQPFVVLLCDHWRRVAQAEIAFSTKLSLWAILIGHEIKQVNRKILIKLFGQLCPERWKEKLGCRIYWHWLHNPNWEIVSADLFLERVIKPKLGWWR